MVLPSVFFFFLVSPSESYFCSTFFMLLCLDLLPPPLPFHIFLFFLILFPYSFFSLHYSLFSLFHYSSSIRPSSLFLFYSLVFLLPLPILLLFSLSSLCSSFFILHVPFLRPSFAFPSSYFCLLPLPFSRLISFSLLLHCPFFKFPSPFLLFPLHSLHFHNFASFSLLFFG